MTDLIHLAIPAFVSLLVLEVVFNAIMRRDLYQIKDTAASLSMGIGNVMVGLVTKAMAFAVYAFVYRFAIFQIPNAWWAWVLLFFADDLTYYTFHRTSHECRLFWASHVVHHSSQRYNLSTALRQTWTGGFIGFTFWLWLPLVGFRPIMVMTMQALSLIYQFWIHTEVLRTMGPFEAVFNSPSHHRVHHGSNVRYLDRNHAGTLIIWDRLFGSFEAEDEAERPVYGLTKNLNSHNPVRIAFTEWINMARDVMNAPTWRAKLRYVFAPPGWSHDGRSKTSDEMRAAKI
ncbi:MAG: sterol desaturase [Candidatus Angelobacter sp.]|jgi:sterol desaturase/sphingolipid hydroxylase (fatty acid hydroxylase superfamily)|nr:sterol desaturase [Candidatus Angelobacter sp.]